MTDQQKTMYIDSDGNACELVALCRHDPEWAASRIVALHVDLYGARGEVERLASERAEMRDERKVRGR